MFPLKAKKKLYKSGPDEHYGLAEELPPDDFTLEDLEIKKNDFINKLKDTDIGNLLDTYCIEGWCPLTHFFKFQFIWKMRLEIREYLNFGIPKGANE